MILYSKGGEDILEGERVMICLILVMAMTQLLVEQVTLLTAELN